MKLLLINAKDPDYKCYRGAFSKFLTYTPLTLAYLAALIPEDLDIELDICDENIESADKIKKQYDVVGISFMSISAYRAYELADKFRKQGSYLLAGGYHPTFLPKEALQHFDTVIKGVAEISFPKFLRDYISGTCEKLYHYPVVDLTNYKFPRRDIISKNKYLNVQPVIANRGCLNACEFCVISSMNSGNTMRPVSNVIDEIRNLKSKRIIFFDPNFFQQREYAMEIMSTLGKIGKKWGCNATTTLAQDDELLECAAKNGCTGVLLGLETLKSDGLKRVGKSFNKPEEYKKIIQKIHDCKIFVLGCFVLGFDFDTKEDLLMLPEQVNYLQVDLPRFGILTPMPNSKLYTKLENENRIITKNWKLYDQNHAVFQPANMEPQELEEIYNKVWEKSFSMKNILQRSLNNNHPGIEKLMLLGANLGFKFVASDAKEWQKCLKEK